LYRLHRRKSNRPQNEMPTHLTLNPFFKATAVAKPILAPVKLPGPRDTAIKSKSLLFIYFYSKIIQNGQKTIRA
jgi:hypothetical protein